jgi:hypothetical protein
LPAEIQVGRTDGWLLNDRIRLIDLLTESLASAGLSYFRTGAPGVIGDLA